MGKLVSRPDQVASNIRKFAAEVAGNPDLQAKLGLVHAWYALRLPDSAWAFGPSKFVGYHDNTAKKYRETYQTDADGRITERALRDLTAKVDRDSRLGRELTRALEEFVGRWGRKPRRGIRISVASDESSAEISRKRETDEAMHARISSDPGICGGRPCIKGTRMRVVDIVEAIAHGATGEELLRDFDYLTKEDIAAALLYAARAADHRVVRTA